jgi:hypothetical protein
MVPECEEGRDTLVHVLTNVFQVQDDHPLSLSLQEHGFHDIQAIVDASKVDIDALIQGLSRQQCGWPTKES